MTMGRSAGDGKTDVVGVIGDELARVAGGTDEVSRTG